MKNFFLCYLVLIGITKAEVKTNTTNSKTIPIIGTTLNTNYNHAEASVSSNQPYTTQKLGDANVGQAVDLIKSLRSDLCSSLGKKDEVRLFLNWDVKTGVFGIGVGMNTGIEVNIKCEK